MMLKDKIAVIHGAGGDVGGAVARAFAREGARLFLSGRNLGTVKAVAADVIGRGGVAEAAQVDALDEQAGEKYGGPGAEKAGTIDISFNAISIRKALPTKAPLLELSAEHFALPITAYTQANFLTARSAARRMVARRSGGHLDDHRHAVSHGVPERRRQCAGVCSGRGADPHPL